LSKKRRMLFWVAIGLAVVCAAPFPRSLMPWF
jgi:hypothetical protein